jgi:putative hydrolase of HD superfamily
VIESDKLKGVLRKVRPVGEERYENTAEHSWQIALFAPVLGADVVTDLDIRKVVSMLLIHDLGEIDVGDNSRSLMKSVITCCTPKKIKSHSSLSIAI